MKKDLQKCYECSVLFLCVCVDKMATFQTLVTLYLNWLHGFFLSIFIPVTMLTQFTYY